MRICDHCKKPKTSKEYIKNKNFKDGLNPTCKTCIREFRLKCDYGLTLKQYQKLFEFQNGCCAICKRHQSKFKRKLSVDHNHKTGVIRRLLCDKCNNQLGYYERKKKKEFEKYLQTVPQRMIKFYKEWLEQELKELQNDKN